MPRPARKRDPLSFATLTRRWCRCRCGCGCAARRRSGDVVHRRRRRTARRGRDDGPRCLRWLGHQDEGVVGRRVRADADERTHHERSHDLGPPEVRGRPDPRARRCGPGVSGDADGCDAHRGISEELGQALRAPGCLSTSGAGHSARGSTVVRAGPRGARGQGRSGTYADRADELEATRVREPAQRWRKVARQRNEASRTADRSTPAAVPVWQASAHRGIRRKAARTMTTALATTCRPRPAAG